MRHLAISSYNLQEKSPAEPSHRLALWLISMGSLLIPTEAQMSSKQYRDFARECLQWADESASEEDRRHFIDMAKAWVQAAAELGELSHDGEAPPFPRPARRKANGARNVRPGT